MKLKYWILILAVAVVVAAGGRAISQEEEEDLVTTTTATPVMLVACFDTSAAITKKNTLKDINFFSVVTSSANFPSCGKSQRLVINGTVE